MTYSKETNPQRACMEILQTVDHRHGKANYPVYTNSLNKPQAMFKPFIL